MKSIIITGASAGIGRATAEAFVAAGWRVGGLARRADALAKIVGIVPIVCDVTDEAAVDAAFDTFAAETGRLDTLFNNAGMFTPQATIDAISLKDWQQAVDVNLTGMFLCARAAFRIMRHQTPQGGRIINNGSISAHVPREGSVCYTTTKHGITGLTKTLALDGRHLGITSGQIDIGNAETEMVQTMQNKRAADGLDPMPTMPVADVANAVLHMAQLPPEATVQTMTIMAAKMPYIGRG